MSDVVSRAVYLPVSFLAVPIELELGVHLVVAKLILPLPGAGRIGRRFPSSVLASLLLWPVRRHVLAGSVRSLCACRSAAEIHKLCSPMNVSTKCAMPKHGRLLS